ncbi:MAG: sulfotransferase domain-containing protein [Candidatus Hydrogenedentes bacterium]|nr:sulfotransferase domain-containing protein [Candidatus Hydrogenedentota bacterium]
MDSELRAIVLPAYLWGDGHADRRRYLDGLDEALHGQGYRLLCIEIGGGAVEMACESRILPKALAPAPDLDWRNVPELGHAVAMEAGFRRCSEEEAAADILPKAAWVGAQLRDSNAALCLLWNQFTGLNRAIAWHCRQMEIPYLYVHLGLLPGTIVFEPQGQMGESWVARHAREFAALPVDADLSERTAKYLRLVRAEKRTRKAQAAPGALAGRIAAERAQGRRIVFYAGQNDYRAGMLPGLLPEARIHSPWYHSTEDALQDLARVAAERNWCILYKPHPNVSEEAPPVHDHIVFAPGANVFECIEAAEVTVTIVSQVAYLALIQGRPAVLLGSIQLTESGASYDAHCRADAGALIARALEQGHTEVQRDAFVGHAARLLGHYLFAYDNETAAILGRYFPETAAYLADMALPERWVTHPLTAGQRSRYADLSCEEATPHRRSRPKERSPRMGWQSVVTRPFARMAAMSGSFLRHVLSDPVAHARLSHDPSLMRLLFRPDSGLWSALRNKDIRRKSGFEEGLFEAIGSKALLEQMDGELVTKFLARRLRDGGTALDEIIPQVGYGVVMEYLCRKAETGDIQTADVIDMLLAKDRGLMSCLLAGETTREALTEDRRFQSLLVQEVLEDDGVLKQLLSREDVIRRILESQHLRNRFRFIHAREMAGRLPYRLPAVVVSYPRAGSNFLQNILKHSSGLHSQSIYGPYPFTEPREITLTVKSHAVSPAYLMDEFQRLVEVEYTPERVVLLQRDPRDVMVSFYEYAQANRKTAIRQDEFLNGIDFFYASTIDPQSRRAVEKNPLTVAEAFRKHIQTWFRERPDHPPCLVLRYEDLVQDPWANFQKVFDFLQVECTLAEEFLRVKVSQYSGTRDEGQRGKAGGWRGQQEKYAALLDQVQREFAEEIRLLGYARD